jgi:hypothetical protein
VFPDPHPSITSYILSFLTTVIVEPYGSGDVWPRSGDVLTLVALSTSMKLSQYNNSRDASGLNFLAEVPNALLTFWDVLFSLAVILL